MEEKFKDILPLFLIAGFFSLIFQIFEINNYIKLIFGIFISLLYICIENFYIKVPKLKFSIDELLTDYIRGSEKFDKKYNNRYIKLECSFSDINFVEKYMVLMKLGKNEKYSVDGKIILPSKKCIKYLKKYEKDNIVVYGEVIRDKTTFFVTIYYIEI